MGWPWPPISTTQDFASRAFLQRGPIRIKIGMTLTLLESLLSMEMYLAVYELKHIKRGLGHPWKGWHRALEKR